MQNLMQIFVFIFLMGVYSGNTVSSSGVSVREFLANPRSKSKLHRYGVLDLYLSHVHSARDNVNAGPIIWPVSLKRDIVRNILKIFIWFKTSDRFKGGQRAKIMDFLNSKRSIEEMPTENQRW